VLEVDKGLGPIVWILIIVLSLVFIGGILCCVMQSQAQPASHSYYDDSDSDDESVSSFGSSSRKDDVIAENIHDPLVSVQFQPESNLGDTTYSREQAKARRLERLNGRVNSTDDMLLTQ